ncbi:hypothetical protein BH10ACI4_BH10ACI4_07980 [soil metagenome]
MRSDSIFRRFSILALGIFLACFSGFLMAQDVNGTIFGVVKDSTGAILSTAKVQVTNAGTRSQSEGIVQSDGSFTLRVPPGVYIVAISAEGFRSVVVQNVTVQVNTQSRIDPILGIGDTSQVVTVAAINNNVDTTSSTLKEVVSEQTIEDAPLNGRNPLSLILLVPGVTRDPNANVTSGATYPGAAGVSINGGRSNTTNYILDGANHNDNYTNAPSPMPIPDALREFSVQTNNFGAEFGRLPGGVVNAITKSGENRVHGSAFEYIRNNFFNAANHFASVSNGIKSDDGLKRHQFGGTFGGPVLIPNVYSGRDKSFFFVSVQETLIHQRPNANSAIVPDAKLRSGDFSEVKTPLYIPYDPAGRTFANNQITQISPVAAAMLAYIPVAPAGTAVNSNGGQTIFYRTVNNSADYQLLTRLDQKLSANNTIYGTFFNSHQTAAPFLDPANYLAYKNAGDWISRRYQASDTHIFSANLLNEASFSYSHNRYANTPIYPTQTLTSLGINLFVPPGTTEYQFNVANYFNLYTGDTNQFIRDEYQGIETIRWSLGKHQLSFGGEYYFGTGDNINNFQQNPSYGFTSSSYTPGTLASSTQNSFADFLLGRFSSFIQGAGEYKNTRFNHYAAFIEDTWRVTPKLVLNLGMRYEPFLPYYDLNNKLATYQPGQRSTMYPNAPVGVVFPGDAGIPRGGFNASYTNVAPRVGLAYDVFGDGKTSFRIGYGIFFDQPNTITTNNQTDQAPFAPVITLNGTAANNVTTPYVGVTNPFPYPTPATPASTFPQYSFQYLYSARMRNAYTQSFNVQVQQDLGFGTIFSVAYAGSAASHLPIARELNAAVYTPGASTTGNTNQRRPFAPALGSSTLLEAAGSSNYNSLQANVRRQFKSGFSVLANYSFSHAIDTASDTKTLGTSRTIPTNPNYDRGSSNFDRRHVINFTSIWKIPSPSQNHYVKALLGGWEHTAIANYTGGYPFSIASGQDNARTGTGGQRASYVPGQQVYLGKRSTAQTQAQYFNPAAFTQPVVGGYGDTARNAYRGPAYTTVDMGLLKNIPITESVKGVFRFEAFNVFNHTNLSLPSSTLTAGNFAQITSALDPRILQFALRVAF